MKTFFTSFAVLMLSVSALFAQVGEQKPEHPIYISVQGGMLFSANENTFSYSDNGVFKDLFTPQGSFSIGYDFGTRAGARLNVNYGKNVSGANVKQTSGNHPETGKHFFPYDFKNASAFLDLTWNIAAEGYEGPLVPKVYAGIGLGHTFGFSNPKHPWQGISDPNNAFGFRIGFLGEVMLGNSFGAFIDLSAEAYTDQFNGLRPSKAEQERHGRGYLGFPFDLCGLASFGLAVHF